MTTARTEIIGNATLILGDCRDTLSNLPRPAAIVSDPPYGQSLKTNITERNGIRDHMNGAQTRHRRKVGTFTGGETTVWPEAIFGDDAPFDPRIVLDAADIVVLWGAHKFADRLPPGGWLVWDKVPTGKVRDQGDGEAAWINQDRAMRIYRLLWDGVCVGSAARSEVTAGQSRLHPTQKPVALMEWTITQARVPQGGVILDPYMGAGSTLVAALKRGHPCIGIEIEPRYFDTACKRVEAAQKQADLFAVQAASTTLSPRPINLFESECE